MTKEERMNLVQRIGQLRDDVEQSNKWYKIGQDPLLLALVDVLALAVIGLLLENERRK